MVTYVDWLTCFTQCAINAVADYNIVISRFDVNVRSSPFKCGEDHGIYELDDGRHLGIARKSVKVEYFFALIGVSLWLTADGDQIWKVGVAPDDEVALPSGVYPARPADDQNRTAAELKATDDSQLQAGYDEVAGELATPVGST